MMPKLQKKFKTILFVFVASRIKPTALKLDPSAVSFVVNNKNWYVCWLCEKLIFLQQNPSTTWSTLLWNTKSIRQTVWNQAFNQISLFPFTSCFGERDTSKPTRKYGLYQPLKFWRKFGVGVERKIEINLCNLTFKGLLSNGFYSCLLYEYNSNRGLKTSALKTA